METRTPAQQPSPTTLKAFVDRWNSKIFHYQNPFVTTRTLCDLVVGKSWREIEYQEDTLKIAPCSWCLHKAAQYTTGDKAPGSITTSGYIPPDEQPSGSQSPGSQPIADKPVTWEEAHNYRDARPSLAIIKDRDAWSDNEINQPQPTPLERPDMKFNKDLIFQLLILLSVNFGLLSLYFFARGEWVIGIICTLSSLNSLAIGGMGLGAKSDRHRS